jgi:hypothetical protein
MAIPLIRHRPSWLMFFVVLFERMARKPAMAGDVYPGVAANHAETKMTATPKRA